MERQDFPAMVPTQREDLPVMAPMQQDFPGMVPMQQDLPVMVPMQRTDLPVGVPMQGNEMLVTKMPIQAPPPSDKGGTLHREVRCIIVVGFIVIACLVATAGVFLLTGKDTGGWTKAVEREGALAPDQEKIGDLIHTVPPRAKEGTNSPIKGKMPPPPRGPSSGGKNRAKPLPRNKMVCTVNGEGPNLEDIRPPGSSVCGIIFFDSLYKEVRKEVAVTFEKNVETFMAWPERYPFASYGISFSLENQKLARDVADSKFEDGIKEMCKKGIIHAAVINIYGDSVNERNFIVALKALEIAHKTFSGCKLANDSYVVLGAVIDQPTAGRLVGLMRQQFVPSLFISITHVSYDDRKRHDCRIVPPTWLDTPKNFQPTDFTYGRPLVESCSVLPVLANGVGIPVAMSFSLSGHMYNPRFVDPALPTLEEYRFFRPCEDFDGNYYVSPPQVCKNGTQMSKDFRTTKAGVVAFDTSMGRTLTFDNMKTLKEKACGTKDKCRGVNFGVATYDLEYDAERLTSQVQACDKFGTPGSFFRLHALVNVHGYLASPDKAQLWTLTGCKTHVEGI